MSAPETPAEPEIDSRSAGERLSDELSTDHDTISVRALIYRARQTADWLERLDGVINGDRREWLRLKTEHGTVEVMVDDAIQKASKLQNDLRYLLAEIFRQRAKLPGNDNDDDDVLAGL